MRELKSAFSETDKLCRKYKLRVRKTIRSEVSSEGLSGHIRSKAYFC